MCEKELETLSNRIKKLEEDYHDYTLFKYADIEIEYRQQLAILEKMKDSNEKEKQKAVVEYLKNKYFYYISINEGMNS